LRRPFGVEGAQPLAKVVTVKTPTEQDRADAMRVVLAAIASGEGPVEVAHRSEQFHTKGYTFPGEELLELAADALELSGASREQPIFYEGVRERHLPELKFEGETQHRRSHYALGAAAMIRAGVRPALLDEVMWWQTNDLFVWALYALVIYVRAAAERTGDAVGIVCRRIAARHGLELPALA
jgi:hypothetical protein